MPIASSFLPSFSYGTDSASRRCPPGMGPRPEEVVARRVQAGILGPGPPGAHWSHTIYALRPRGPGRGLKNEQNAKTQNKQKKSQTGLHDTMPGARTAPSQTPLQTPTLPMQGPPPQPRLTHTPAHGIAVPRPM